MMAKTVGRLLLCYLAVTLLDVDAPAIHAAESAKYGSASNLYLIRHLEHVLSTWKPPASDPREMGRWINDTRLRLRRLQVSAQSYGGDELIVAAYKDVLELLDAYESYLKDIVYFDLITNSARPEGGEFVYGVASSAAIGAGTGFASGSIVPGVGNLVGAGIGGVGGLLSAISSDRKYIERCDELSEHTKQVKLEQLERLRNRVQTTYEVIKHQASILGGSSKYNWGRETGFDGSESLSPDRRLELRPRDSFLHLAIGLASASSDPRSAALHLHKAALHVPSDIDEVDCFDLDRAEFLLLAARIAERGARASNPHDVALGEIAVQYYSAAIKCLSSGDANVDVWSKLAFARALAMTGSHSKADETLRQVSVKYPAPESLLYEYAAVKSVGGKFDEAMDYLHRSYVLAPRWDPSALRDPRLSALVADRRAEVVRVCADPLIGTWTTNNLSLEFYADGAVRQTSKGVTSMGRYERNSGATMRLTSEKVDRVFEYRIDNRGFTPELCLGSDLRLSKTPSRLVGSWSCKGERFEFRNDGTWTRTPDGSISTNGTYCIAALKGAVKRQLILQREDVGLMPIEKRFDFEIDDDELRIHMPGYSEPFKYRRS